MIRIVDADNYQVFIGDSAVYENINSFLSENYPDSKYYILVDENTIEACYPGFAANIPALGDAEVLQIPSGEENKTIDICAQLWKSLQELGADRSALIINLGGGVIGDMGGFVASTFKRGVDFIQVPTTLLSQVDASVGGKLGVDLDGYKNMVGLFQNPKAVFINTDFLHTLDGRQVKSGLAEVIKHGLIADQNYHTKISETEPEDINWNDIVFQSVSIKNNVVLEDPREKGLRKILNFGHTIGHAVETHFLGTKSELLHGESVIIGSIMEAYLSNQYGELRATELKAILNLVRTYYVLPEIDPSICDILYGHMKKDKKNIGQTVEYVQLEKIGKAIPGAVLSKSQFAEALDFYNSTIKSWED